MNGTPEGLAKQEAACRRCPLFRTATQVVPGEGPTGAAIMLVGEQPGDREDVAGKPFVGPAGRILDKALREAGIARDRVFVTNAVKHFKFEMRGKRRLHKRPNADEIDSCRWWLDQELALVKPSIVVALGVTAVRGLLGRPMTLTAVRRQTVARADGVRVAATIHPSSLLRRRGAEDEDTGEAYRAFVDDPRRAARLAGSV